MGGLRKGKFWFAFIVFFIALVVGLDIDVAYAADNVQWRYDGVVYGPEWVSRLNYPVDSNAQQWVIVNAPDSFSAAVYACGGNPYDLTSDQKALLSNSSTGGDFYQFSLHFVNIGGSFDRPDWFVSGDNSRWIQGVYRDYADLYGEDDLYIAAFTPAEKTGAYAQYDLIKDGGGSGSGAGNKYTLSKDMSYTYLGASVGSYSWKIPLNGTGISLDSAPMTCDVVVSDGLKSKIDSWLSSGRNVIMYIDGTNNSSYPNPRLNVISLTSNTTLGTATDIWNITYLSINSTGGSAGVYSGMYQADVSSAVGVPSLVYTYNSYFTGDTSKSIPMRLHLRDFNDANRFQYWGGYQLMLYSDGTTSTPQIPESNWPDDDSVVPTPPELPEPQDPVTDPQPDSTFPIYVDVSTTDYTADLHGVLEAMDDHCVHLQESIWWGFNSFWNKLYQYITWSVGVMQLEFSATRDYLHDLFHWLAEQFDYSVSGGAYNDSTVVSWLKKIYSILGRGVNTRPIDPVADPDGIGDWLGQLFANFVSWLLGFGAGVVTGLASDFTQLTHKFPFSIPWDIGAMLALMVAEPLAPAFDYPLYTMDASGSLVQAGTLEVDLSDFDSYMVGIRFMQKLLFCFYLAWRTPQLKEMLRIGRGR